MRTEGSRQRIPRGRPAFAEAQRAFVLRKLREPGECGVSRATFIFDYRATQCGARVDEQKRERYIIESVLRDGDTYITYVLRSEPAEPRKVSTDWYERATGRPRSAAQPPADDLPLFRQRL